jgi:flagellar basal-body rod protein FlgB
MARNTGARHEKLRYSPTTATKRWGHRATASIPPTEVLASNLANADTPNYKARDIDFREVLAATAESATPLKMAATHPVHLDNPSLPSAAELKYRVPLAPSLDGNTVDPAVEQASFAENSVRYRASLKFVSDEFGDLMLAINRTGILTID